MSDLKRQAAEAAADLATDGMVLGLGTGSTTTYAIQRLGARVRDRDLRDVVGIPTSLASGRLAREVGLTVVGFEHSSRIDLTIDGADEVDDRLDLIKGGGGALLREKVVASRSRLVVIVVDESKLSSRLGSGFDLPVEVVPFAATPVAEELSGLGGKPTLRRAADGGDYRTDNGNAILDLAFPGGIDDPAALELAIDAIPGVVESGLFIGLAHRLIVGRPGGTEVRERP